MHLPKSIDPVARLVVVSYIVNLPIKGAQIDVTRDDSIHRVEILLLYFAKRKFGLSLIIVLGMQLLI